MITSLTAPADNALLTVLIMISLRWSISLSSGNLKEITLKARGQAITTAVDVAEITRNRFVKDLKVSKIAIGTAEMPPREGENKSRMVSTMEITLSKEKAKAEKTE